jgi:hypothetical protein
VVSVPSKYGPAHVREGGDPLIPGRAETDMAQRRIRVHLRWVARQPGLSACWASVLWALMSPHLAHSMWTVSGAGDW